MNAHRFPPVFVFFYLALAFGPAVFGAVPEGEKNAKEERTLMGTWVLDQKTNKDSADPNKTETIKTFGKRRWSVTYRNVETGIVEFHTGGTYEIKDGIVIETTEFSLPNTRHLIGEKNRFEFSIKEGVLYYKGLDRAWDEKWERLD